MLFIEGDKAPSSATQEEALLKVDIQLVPLTGSHGTCMCRTEAAATLVEGRIELGGLKIGRLGRLGERKNVKRGAQVTTKLLVKFYQHKIQIKKNQI
jgi:hypothetical protein